MLATGSHVLSSALKAGSTLPPLATRTALTTLASTLGKASTSVFCACTWGSTGRGGFWGGISVASSLKRTPGLGDLEPGDGDLVFSCAETAEVSLSSSKSSSRAVVGLSGGCRLLVGELPYTCYLACLVSAGFLRHVGCSAPSGASMSSVLVSVRGKSRLLKLWARDSRAVTVAWNVPPPLMTFRAKWGSINQVAQDPNCLWHLPLSQLCHDSGPMSIGPPTRPSSWYSQSFVRRCTHVNRIDTPVSAAFQQSYSSMLCLGR